VPHHRGESGRRPAQPRRASVSAGPIRSPSVRAARDPGRGCGGSAARPGCRPAG
jgi:hypothetical protein